MPRRYLLDTNVVRKFACGELSQEWERAKALRDRYGQSPFATSDLVVHEILAHIVPAEARNFPQFRSALDVLDVLVGNEGMQDRSDEILPRTLFIAHPRRPMADVVALNRLRRRLLKANSYTDISCEDRRVCQTMAESLEGERKAWATWMEGLKAKLIAAKSDTNAGMRKVECTEIVRLVRENRADALARHAEADGLLYGGARPRTEIEGDLREYIYFEAALVLKAMNKGGYNFAAHKNDHYDQLLCSYTALGYYLVTEDQRMIDMLKNVECPEPRIIGIREALEEMGHDLPWPCLIPSSLFSGA